MASRDETRAAMKSDREKFNIAADSITQVTPAASRVVGYGAEGHTHRATPVSNAGPTNEAAEGHTNRATPVSNAGPTNEAAAEGHTHRATPEISPVMFQQKKRGR